MNSKTPGNPGTPEVHAAGRAPYSPWPALAFALLLIALPSPRGPGAQSSYFEDNNTPATLVAQTGPGGGGAVRSTQNLGGFGGIGWDAKFSDVKKHIKNLVLNAQAGEKVEVLMEERNKYILVRRNDVLYRYSFYKTPYSVELIDDHTLTREDHDLKEAVLFHVKITMPLIESSMVKDRLEKIYGKSTKTTVDPKEMSGADIWELNNGLIFQWYEPYNKKAFTRNVDYLSTALAKRIMREYANYFDARERLILKKLNLN